MGQLHFQSSSLLMAWQQQWQVTQAFGPLRPSGRQTQMKLLALDLSLAQP